MTPQEFNEMLFDARGTILMEDGEFLLEREIYHGYVAKMYSLSDFFVEIYCMDNNTILDITALQSDDDWKGFLRSINIKLLLNT